MTDLAGNKRVIIKGIVCIGLFAGKHAPTGVVCGSGFTREMGDKAALSCGQLFSGWIKDRGVILTP
ncbi:hypothetical protein CXG53_24110 [Pseudomonas guariconensis]|uniref:Uncharacterized protein n=1 Tax=Pseudomonas guariconensis TaxID=1288410 RepID=A0AAX0VRP7_9PSED|nr:hypothetical protein CXG49_24000 [Pseudomonas guariconensis]PLV21662.1 hypothetical protein CXG53_24110 [Pseudomonas guariconensis]PLV26782.1 hypothetical protein CXG51_24105 [Pseudomonas guariconensis]